MKFYEIYIFFMDIPVKVFIIIKPLPISYLFK